MLFRDCRNAYESVDQRRTTNVLGAILTVLLLSIPGFAQLNLGRIFGGITDQSGGAIVGATVTVIDVQRGIARPLTTDAAGEYSAPSLTPGTYTVRAEAKGFKTIERTDIVVGVGQDIRIDLTLQPGEQTQTVTVTGEVPEVNTTNAQLGGTLENREINELPINGRQYTHLLDYHPGVLMKPGASSQAFLSNGGRPEAQVWMLDGLYDLNIYSGGGPIIGGNAPGAGPDQATILPLDAIQEVNVMENPKAEYGWKPGAQVNVGLKSGTNNIHGTAYAFGSDSALDAKNAFLTAAQPKASEDLEQFGSTIGGPIKKDRIFYFAGYEGQRILIASPRTVQIPTTVAGVGAANSFPDAIAALNAAHVPLSQLSLNLAGCTTTGVCNVSNGVFGNSTNSATEALQLNTPGGSDNVIGKVDYHINEHNTLNGEYFFGNGNFLNGNLNIQPYWRLALHARANVARAVWVWTPNSNWANEARFGLDRSNLPATVGECQENLGQPNYTAQFGFVSGAPLCGFPAVTINTFTAFGVANTTLLQATAFTTYSGSDSVSYTHGKHLFKFGGELHISPWTGAAFTNANGAVSFGTVAPAGLPTANPLEDFLAGIPSSGSVLLGNPVRHLLERGYAGFAQDDWRIMPRLTINLGLRYEFEPPIVEQNNLIGNFDPAASTGLIQATSSDRTVYNSDANNFAPRIGLAWDVTGKGTTVVRAGAGIVYTTTTLLNLISTPQGAQLNAIPTGFNLYQTNGTKLASPGNIAVGNVNLTGAQIPWSLNTPVFNSTAAALSCGNGLGQVNPAAGTGAANPANPPPCNIAAINPNFRQGYLTTWTLGVQHAFTNALSLDVAYVGNHADKLGGVVDANQPAVGAKNGGTAPTSGNEQLRRPYYSMFPYLGKIYYYSGIEESNYNALQTALTQRVSHGLNFTVGYTYAHALDDSSADTASTIVMDSLNPKLDYGNSLYDARHHVNFTVTYVIPGKKLPGQILQGWQVNSTVNLIGSFPWNAADTTSDISGTGELLDRWTLVGNPADFKAGGPGALPCFASPTSTTFTAKTGCTVGLPTACVTAAAAEPTGPGGTTGTTTLNSMGCYMEGNSVIVPPAQGTFGSMARDVLRGRAFHEWDLSLDKNWRFKERLTVQFRAEFFNVLNQTNYTFSPNSNPAAPSSFGQASSTPNSSNPLIGTGGPRQIQFGLKLIY